MIFSAWHHETLLEMCENFPNQLLDFGFFTEKSTENNNEEKSFELICKTVEKYEQLLHSDNDKIIMKVAKRTSHLSLALTTMSPLYVSHNVVKGEKECSEIFNEEFYAFQDDVEDEEET